MGEKNKKRNGEQKEGAESTKKESGGNKGNVTVLKADLHCEGCVTKVLKCIRTYDGVDTANIGDGLITVVGKVDPAKLRERVEKKTHKKIELVSPQNNKNGDGKEKTKGRESGGDAKKEEKKKESHDKNSSHLKSGEKKSKEPQVTTAVLKVQLHCEGCIHKIRKIVTRTKGYRDMKIDRQKETVTVTGALDMKALAEDLKKHVKREVQIVPAKKEAEKKEDSGGAKAKGDGGGDKGKNGGGGGEKAAGVEKTEGNKVQFQVAYPNPNPYPYPYPMVYESGLAMDQFHYNPYAYGPNQAPQLFSDENPNACSIM